MKDFRGKLAVVTGGGTGMGRELACQLASEGCHVAMCDVNAENMKATKKACEQQAPAGTRITAHVCDVSDESQVQAFRDAVKNQHQTEHINLLFSNAGIGGGGGFVGGPREEWEKTFGVCWWGVYYCARAFMPLLVASSEGHIVNTSSVNGFWAYIDPMTPDTAYSTAKFAIKGFSEALLTDLRVNAPHVKVSVVMPGHIGTSIVENTGRVLGWPSPKEMTEEDLDEVRRQMKRRELPEETLSDEQLREALQQQMDDFRDMAPTTAAQAANIILDGVRAERWRILVGDDAHTVDRLVREAPEEAYEPSLIQKLQDAGTFEALDDVIALGLSSIDD